MWTLDYQKLNPILVCVINVDAFPNSSSQFILFLVNIVDLTTRSNTVVRPQETLLEGGFVYILGLTNSEGLPVELCNDNDFENGVCDRGLCQGGFFSN